MSPALMETGMSEHLSRRSIMLTGLTAGLAAGGAAALPAGAETTFTFSDEPSALLAEHRRRAGRYSSLEAHYQQLHDIAYEEIDASFPSDYGPETEAQVDAAFAAFDRGRQHRLRQLDVAKSHVADIDRRIWAIPASTYDDIVARAELAAFWNRGWGFHDHHGYDDDFADRRLADAILIDQPPRPSSLAVEPPALILDYRREQEAWKRDYHERPRTRLAHHNAVMAHFKACHAIEQALLDSVTPAHSWSDIVIRAELTQYYRRNMLCTQWAEFDNNRARSRNCDLLNHRSYAELLTGVLALGGVPRPPKLPYEDDLPANFFDILDDDDFV